jgi:hypothetical protein
MHDDEYGARYELESAGLAGLLGLEIKLFSKNQSSVGVSIVAVARPDKQ